MSSKASLKAPGRPGAPTDGGMLNRAARATIDTAALQSNLETVRRAAPGSRVMAVIKANAYGHGIVPVANALRGADAFAVARLEEAIALREAGFDQRIVLLEGVFHPEQLQRAAQLALELVVHCPEQVEMLESADVAHQFPVWLKIDTGMHRLGFPPVAADSVVARLRDCTAVGGPLRYMTHLACADETGASATGRQIREFEAVLEGVAGERTIANSAGLLAWPESHADWVRPGLMLYGASPFAGRTGEQYGLKPAMTLSSELIAVNSVPAGGRVGYGGAWTASCETRIGVAAIGYGDGYPRHLGNGTPVQVAGRPAALVGRISMDMITIDLAHVPDAAVGDEVVLWGAGVPIEPLAEAAGTIAYELLCGVTQRVAMRVI